MFALVLNAVSVRQFLITSKRQVAMIKSRVILSILYKLQQNFSDMGVIEWETSVKKII